MRAKHYKKGRLRDLRDPLEGPLPKRKKRSRYPKPLHEKFYTAALAITFSGFGFFLLSIIWMIFYVGVIMGDWNAAVPPAGFMPLILSLVTMISGLLISMAGVVIEELRD
jgi:apolipoprotein N-acyltransferase